MPQIHHANAKTNSHSRGTQQNSTLPPHDEITSTFRTSDKCSLKMEKVG